jgi:hypothetical protein
MRVNLYRYNLDLQDTPKEVSEYMVGRYKLTHILNAPGFK